jgi:hypothetical protein
VAPLLIYGVVRAGHPLADPPPLGLGDPPGPLRLVRRGALAVVVSPVAELGTLTDHDAERHLDILIDLLDDGPVIPLRLGSVAPDDDAVREEVLGETAPWFSARLDSLDGLVEVHVDADEDETAAIHAVLATEPSLAGRRLAAGNSADVGSRISLGELVADRVITRRADQAERLLDELRPFAVADTGRGPMGGPEDPVLRWAFLVHRDSEPGGRDLEHFDEAVARARHDNAEFVIEYVGPLPAFHFVGTAEAVGEPAGGRWGW